MNKTLKVMTSAAMLAGVVAPVAATTVDAASASVTALSTPVVGKTASEDLGAIKITVPAGAQVGGQQLRISLSDGKFNAGVAAGPTYTTADTVTVRNATSFASDVEVLVVEDGGGNAFEDLFDNNQITAYYVANDAFVIDIAAGASLSALDDGVLMVRLNDVDLRNVDTGDIKVSLTASPRSGFPTGSVAVAKTGNDDSVSLAVGSVDNSAKDFTVDVTVTEETIGALDNGDRAEIKLPDGYAWTRGLAGASIDVLFGNIDPDDIEFDVGGDSDRSLFITYDGTTTSELTSVKFKGVPFSMVDEDKVKPGDVVAQIRLTGLDSDVSEATVGKYGEFKVVAEGDTDVPTILAAKNEQKVGNITIKEDIAETLVEGRTITIKLPEGAEFVRAKQVITNEGGTLTADGTATTTLGSRTNSDNDTVWNTTDTLRYEVTSASDDPAELVIKDLEVAVEAGFEGDLVAEIGGTAGVTGKVTLAKVIAPVSMNAEDVPNVIVGKGGQKAADVTITEGVKAAFESKDNGTVLLDLPAGVQFTKKPAITVEDENGNELKIEDVKLVADNNQVSFNIDAESSVASTIKVSDIELTLYRDVPEGNVIVMKLQGGDINRTQALDIFDAATVASVVVANVATPAPTETGAGESVFTIGSTTYTVNGDTKTMDVAPFIEAGRTYLPVRFAAEAAGADFINWDQATQTATILKGDRVASMKLNTNSITVNGGTITMDVPVKLVNDRVVLPLRFVGQALGKSVDWNETDQTVTVK